MIEDTLLPTFVGIVLVVFIIALILRKFKQPHIIAYIIAGALIGPSGLAWIRDASILSSLGNLGIVLLLFFIGLHVSLPQLAQKWKIAIIGTIAQIILSITAIILIGARLGWPLPMSIFFGFVISLSSTAVVIKILEDWNEVHTKVGQNVLGVLLVQDLAVIPMLILINFLSGADVSTKDILLSLQGGLIILVLIMYVMYKGGLRIPMDESMKKDPEMQILGALILCFGLAFFSAYFGLSPALGAFAAGIIVATSQETPWIQKSLEPLRIIFVGLFFMYIGLLIDLRFLLENAATIGLLVLAVFILNTLINFAVLKSLGVNTKESLYAAALLAQIGEFSFLLGAIGLASGIISDYVSNLIISVISISLLLSPLWILLFKKIIGIDANYVFELPKKIMRHVARGR